MTPHEFVRKLRKDVEAHPGVSHPFLWRFANGSLTRWQVWGYASQHYYLVCFFPAYLEAIVNRTPDPQVRHLVRAILEDEYMRPQSHERSHAALYRRFLRAVGFPEGEWDRVERLPATKTFVSTHLDMTLRSWLQTLGAVGPGHEWAIPLMFPHLVQGIEKSLSLDRHALEYFYLHIDKDVEHGRLLEESLLRWAVSDENQREIRCGAQCSLEARAAFWGALQTELFPELLADERGQSTFDSSLDTDSRA